MIITFDQSKKDQDQDQNKIKILYKFSSMEKLNTETGVLEGVAVPYNEQTDDWRRMAFAPGAFENLKKVSAFVNHDSWDVFSMIGGSEFKDSPKALNFKMTLNLKDPDITNKLIPLIDMGALEGVSIGAYIYKREMELDDDGEIIQITITKAEIYELSIVTFQAFENAKIQANKEIEMAKKNKQNKKTIVDTVELNQEPPAAEPVIETAEVIAEPEVIETAEVVEPVVETEIIEPVVETMSNEELQTALKAKDEEIAKLKKDETDSGKKAAIKELIKAGIVHKAHEERIFSKFESAESINEFYKGIPAAFSTEPKGEGGVDLTSEDLKSEQHTKLAAQTSLKKEDYDKYNK